MQVRQLVCHVAHLDAQAFDFPHGFAVRKFRLQEFVHGFAQSRAQQARAFLVVLDAAPRSDETLAPGAPLSLASQQYFGLKKFGIHFGDGVQWLAARRALADALAAKLADARYACTGCADGEMVDFGHVAVAHDAMAPIIVVIMGIARGGGGVVGRGGGSRHR